MGVRFAGTDNLDDFWNFLVSKKDGIKDVNNFDIFIFIFIPSNHFFLNSIFV